LLLREDNADLRLTEIGRKLGLVGDAQWQLFERRRDAIALEIQRLETTYIQPDSDPAKQLSGKIAKPLGREYSLADLLRRPELGYSDVAMLAGDSLIPDEHAAEQVATQVKYAGYIERQQEEIARFRRHEDTAIPVDMDYSLVSGLSNEISQKLAQARPATLARAGRISGVTPAALSLLLVHLKKREKLARVANG